MKNKLSGEITLAKESWRTFAWYEPGDWFERNFTIHLNDGTELTGNSLSEHDDMVSLDTDTESFRIPKSRILYIRLIKKKDKE